jgi:hypothetical protein
MFILFDFLLLLSISLNVINDSYGVSIKLMTFCKTYMKSRNNCFIFPEWKVILQMLLFVDRDVMKKLLFGEEAYQLQPARVRIP